MDEEQKKVLGRLGTACARREYCVGDVRTKALKALGGDARRAAEVVDSLIEDGFVDDLRYASAFAREKSALSGWGPVKIRFALRAKGIGDSEIDGAMAGIDEDKAMERLDKVLRTKASALSGDPQIRMKLIKFALSRGYSYEDVRKHMDKY